VSCNARKPQWRGRFPWRPKGKQLKVLSKKEVSERVGTRDELGRCGGARKGGKKAFRKWKGASKDKRTGLGEQVGVWGLVELRQGWASI